MNEDDWAKEIFSEEEVRNINARAERVIGDMTTDYIVSLTIPREEAIAACRHYDAVSRGSLNSVIYCFEILESLVETLEVILEVDGINPYEGTEDD